MDLVVLLVGPQNPLELELFRLGFLGVEAGLVVQSCRFLVGLLVPERAFDLLVPEVRSLDSAPLLLGASIG